jgi:hypothetical protein
MTFSQLHTLQHSAMPMKAKWPWHISIHYRKFAYRNCGKNRKSSVRNEMTVKDRLSVKHEWCQQVTPMTDSSQSSKSRTQVPGCRAEWTFRWVPTFRENGLLPSSILKMRNFELVDEWVEDNLWRMGEKEVKIHFINKSTWRDREKHENLLQETLCVVKVF